MCLRGFRLHSFMRALNVLVAGAMPALQAMLATAEQCLQLQKWRVVYEAYK